MVAQTGHAVSGANFDVTCAMIALQVSSAEELKELINKAHKAGIDACYVQDAGRTEVPPGSITCGYIGPAEDEEIDKITGHLKKL